VIFEDLPGSASARKRWERRRQLVYKTSFRYFLMALGQHELKKDGFAVYSMIRKPNPLWLEDSIRRATENLSQRDNRGRTVRTFYLRGINRTIDSLGVELHENDLLQSPVDAGVYALQFKNMAYVVCKNSRISNDIDDLKRFDVAGEHPIAAFKLNNPLQPALFNSQGIPLSKEQIHFEGIWSGRIANMLPENYLPGAN
jgi:hypothetical protein